MAKNDQTTEGNDAAAPTEVARKMTREELRELAFSPEKTIAERIPIKFNGIDLEWQRPSIQEIQEQQDRGDKNFILTLLIGYSFIPNTEEKFFVEDDYAVIAKMPFSQDYSDVVNKLVSALNLRVDDKVKN